MLGSAPMELIKVDWNDQVGIIYKDLDYNNDYKYDLYLPANLNKDEGQKLILFIHGGSFNSGSKEDMDEYCKYYTSKGYITATVDYSLQNHGKKATIQMMDEEIVESVEAMKVEIEELGYSVNQMAVSGVSAGGTLAMNLAYDGNSPIPVKFVFQLAAPTYFEPDDWDLLKLVDHIDSDQEFIEMMTGYKVSNGNYQKYIDEISPASKVNESTVPTLIGYGLMDHCVPLNQKFYLIDQFDKYHITYDYIAFPNSNHGMYNDLDKLQEYIDQSLEYCDQYFE